MNGIIMGLYEIEEQAGKLMEEAAARREELLEENRRKMADFLFCLLLKLGQ